MHKPAPVVLFVYNRPFHTQKTLQALENSPMASTTDLYVFSDGPKTERDVNQVDAVRAIFRAPLKFNKVVVKEREKNVGLAANVIDGVTAVIDAHEKVIVLEDDVLLTAYALDYFNDALTKYQDVDKVMHIGSYMYNIDRRNLDETFFTRLTMSQAWGTWKRSWDHFEQDIDVLMAKFDRDKIKAFSFDHTMNFWKQINEQKGGNIDSWAVRWYASVFLKDGLALQTKYSLLDNIGHDGSGVHSSISSMFDTEIQTTKVSFFPDAITEDPTGYKVLKHYFKHHKGSLLDRGCRFLINKWHKLFRK